MIWEKLSSTYLKINYLKKTEKQLKYPKRKIWKETQKRNLWQIKQKLTKKVNFHGAKLYCN